MTKIHPFDQEALKLISRNEHTDYQLCRSLLAIMDPDELLLCLNRIKKYEYASLTPRTNSVPIWKISIKGEHVITESEANHDLEGKL